MTPAAAAVMTQRPRLSLRFITTTVAAAGTATARRQQRQQARCRL
jgi:hypothetical protein